MKRYRVMKHIVFFSGGIGSFGVAYRLVFDYKIPREDIILLFTDTKMEDEGLYRFLDDATKFLGTPLTYIADGRTLGEYSFDVRFLGIAG